MFVQIQKKKTVNKSDLFEVMIFRKFATMFGPSGRQTTPLGKGKGKGRVHP